MKERICENCGKKIVLHDYRVKYAKKLFCDKKCYNEYYKKRRLSVTCDWCGTKIDRIASRAHRNTHHFCNRVCQKKWLVENTAGSNSSSFGKKMSEETKMKLSKAKKGNSNSAWKGKHLPKETCAKLSKALKGKYKGKDCPAWKGGISFGIYCSKFNMDLKERVREYFDRKCYVCGATEEQNGEKLCVHHVNYDKAVCCNKTKPLFVPLCRKHHVLTNNNREHWEKFFMVSLEYLTKNKCFYTMEEMKW